MGSTETNKIGNGVTFIDIDEEETGSENSSLLKKRKNQSTKSSNKAKKLKRTLDQDAESSISTSLSGKYCWICHLTDSTLDCQSCPRAYHTSCLDGFYSDHPRSQLPNCSKPSSGPSSSGSSAGTIRDAFVCPECILSMLAECINYGNGSQDAVNSNLLKHLTPNPLRESLLYIVLRLYHYNGASYFQDMVDEKVCRDYNKVIKNPMYLSLLKQKIEDNNYGSVQHFLSEFKWIYHNCFIYNGENSITSCAHNLESLCTKEISFLESCATCFRQRLPFMTKLLKDQTGTLAPAASKLTKLKWSFSFDSLPIEDMWITEVCGTIHPLVWVRLQGYPTWPGKMISMDEDHALVLFFGDYDLNIVPVGSMCIHSAAASHKHSLPTTNSGSSSAGAAGQGELGAPPGVLFQHGIVKEYNLARQQLQLHIDKVRVRYPHFCVPPKKYENNILKGIDFYRKMADSKYIRRSTSSSSYKIITGTPKKYQSSSSPSHVDTGICGKKELRDHDSLNMSSKAGFIASFESQMQSLVANFKQGYWQSFSTEGGLEEGACLTDLDDTSCQPRSAVQGPSGAGTGTFTVTKTECSLQDPCDADKVKMTDAVAQVSVLSSRDSAEFQSMRQYVEYLESKLTVLDTELRRRDLLLAIRHEEHSLETSRQHSELRRLFEYDLQSIVRQTAHRFKTNEWCAFCGKPALFYCCWNTCYCNADCQARHWTTHKLACVQLAKQFQAPQAAPPKPAASTQAPLYQQQVYHYRNLANGHPPPNMTAINNSPLSNFQARPMR